MMCSTRGRRGTVLLAHPSPDLYGSDRMLLESVDALLATGWRVVATVPRSGPLVMELSGRGVEVAVIDVPVLRKSLMSPLGLARFVADTVRCLPAVLRLLRRERPDAVYVNTVTIPLWLVAAWLSRRPVLGHVHEAEHEVPRAVRVALALPLLLASSIVVNSRASAEVVGTALPRLRRRTRLLYNGVEGPEDRLPLRPDAAPPTRLVLIGRLSPRKGSDLAVDAVAALRRRGREVTLDLAGSVFPGYEWYERELRERVRRHGLDGAVRFLGFVPSVWDAYRRADIALVPSRIEPFGNAAVEGQLSGRPVVVTRTQGLVEIVEDGNTGVVVRPDDPEALADGIVSLVDDWPRARELAAAGRAAAMRRFAPARYRMEIAAAVADLVRP
jgi:glycosyltransferase involved in cell wall biosynthesis